MNYSESTGERAMRAVEWVVRDGKLSIKSQVPTSDIHCFFGDDTDSIEILESWEHSIRQSMTNDSLALHLTNLKARTDHLATVFQC